MQCQSIHQQYLKTDHLHPKITPPIRQKYQCQIRHASIACNASLSPSTPDPQQSILAPLVQGKRFECTACGDCCRGGGAEVSCNTAEATAIAKFLHISYDKFVETYCKQYSKRPGWHFLKSKGPDQACIFLESDGRCSVYSYRPLQCVTYPYWPELMSDSAWQNEAKFCEGINSDAPCVDVGEAVQKLSAASEYFAAFEAANAGKMKTKKMKNIGDQG